MPDLFAVLTDVTVIFFDLLIYSMIFKLKRETLLYRALMYSGCGVILFFLFCRGLFLGNPRFSGCGRVYDGAEFSAVFDVVAPQGEPVSVDVLLCGHRVADCCVHRPLHGYPVPGRVGLDFSGSPLSVFDSFCYGL